MKAILLFFNFLLFPLILFSQSIDEFPLSFTNKKVSNFKEKIKYYNLPYVDINSELKRFDANTSASITRFGKRVNIDMLKIADKYDVGNGYIYILKLKAEKCMNIQFTYDDFLLSNNSYIYIYNEEEKQILNPITSKNNKAIINNRSEVIIGNQVTMELFEPKNTVLKNKIIIKGVTYEKPNNDNNNIYLKNNDCLTCYDNPLAEGKEKEAAATCILYTEFYNSDGKVLNRRGSGFLINPVVNCPVPYDNCDFMKEPILITNHHNVHIKNYMLDKTTTYGVFNEKGLAVNDCKPMDNAIQSEVKFDIILDKSNEDGSNGDWAVVKLKNFPDERSM